MTVPIRKTSASKNCGAPRVFDPAMAEASGAPRETMWGTS